ncbi:methyltransferase domain-containing protein [Sphaerisporangium fuscum]|uniref:methyltransferase domain-containing protein n=1 Tax=Sphaerisporangium fuscum TaxID=2835868 RepID=UPI001BDCB812|nr:methyltransferase domain-containing protein [Sphaerisporangium fuscum]
MTAARLVARCVRGLEPVVAAEILDLGLGVITRLGHREVHFHAVRPDPGVVRLRTADDVFLLATRLPDIGAARTGVGRLAELAGHADVAALLEERTLCGGRSEVTGVEVSASFLGRRNFNRYDVEDAVGPALARRAGVGYHSRRGGGAPPPGLGAWRLTLDGRWATLMLRIADRPLHRRAYKVRTIPGTLHPPLAAAIARMADIRPGDRVVDPCCGAGTLLAEAALLRPDARFDGYDVDPEARTAARANVAGFPAVAVHRADAGDLPLPDGGAHRVVCNPPWGGQVGARGLLAGSPSRWWAELRRILAPDGVAVVLIPDIGGLVTAIRHGLEPVGVQRVRLSGAESYIVRLTGGRVRRRGRT